MEKEVLLTAEGLHKLELELENLKSVKRREVAERIRQARDFGDISENSEYEDAKNEQAFIEGRILTLEKILRNARLADSSEVEPDRVFVGSRVRLLNLDTNGELEYELVGATEADPRQGRISNESPVGKALMGKKVGSVVEVAVPAGQLRYRVVSVAH